MSFPSTNNDEKLYVWDRADSKSPLSPFSSSELRNDLNRANLTKKEKHLLVTELDYRADDSPTTQRRWDDQPIDDDDSDGSQLCSVRDALGFMERREYGVRNKMPFTIMVKCHSSSLSDATKETATTDVSTVASSTSLADTPDPIASKRNGNGARGSTRKKNLEKLSPTISKVEGILPTSESSNALKSAPAVCGGTGTRKNRSLDRTILRPKRGPQVAHMAPGYRFLRGTRFDKNIGKQSKSATVAHTKDPEEYTIDDLDAEREMEDARAMYHMHEYQDRMKWKRHFDEIDMHGVQLKNDEDSD